MVNCVKALQHWDCRCAVFENVVGLGNTSTSTDESALSFFKDLLTKAGYSSEHVSADLGNHHAAPRKRTQRVSALTAPR